MAAKLAVPTRATITSKETADQESTLTREVNNLKARIRALNAVNLNLRRRISELEGRGQP